MMDPILTLTTPQIFFVLLCSLIAGIVGFCWKRTHACPRCGHEFEI
jgi:hypothetical protein